MKHNVLQLAEIAQKNERIIIGLMSGTSLDGLDVALCKISGSGFATKAEILHFETLPFDDELRTDIRKIFAKRTIDFQYLVLLNGHIAKVHAAIINDCIQRWNVNKSAIDLIASHGQTVYHAPKHFHGLEKFGNATLQIADGDRIARDTGIITISDFRQKHIAAGGEGAPLAAYGDLLLFRDAENDVFLLNIGGVSNVSMIRRDGEYCSYDIGPGNNLMDIWTKEKFGIAYDKDAGIARQGIPNEKLINALENHYYFDLPFPKTTGPETFNIAYIEKAIEDSGNEEMSLEDVLHSLCKFTSYKIAEEINGHIKESDKAVVYASGGGIHNPLLMQYINQQCSVKNLTTTAEKNINPDAKEALLFAVLANECVAGEMNFYKENFTNIPAVTMGKISFPD